MHQRAALSQPRELSRAVSLLYRVRALNFRVDPSLRLTESVRVTDRTHCGSPTVLPFPHFTSRGPPGQEALWPRCGPDPDVHAHAGPAVHGGRSAEQGSVRLTGQGRDSTPARELSVVTAKDVRVSGSITFL